MAGYLPSTDQKWPETSMRPSNEWICAQYQGKVELPGNNMQQQIILHVANQPKAGRDNLCATMCIIYHYIPFHFSGVYNHIRIMCVYTCVLISNIFVYTQTNPSEDPCICNRCPLWRILAAKKVAAYCIYSSAQIHTDSTPSIITPHSSMGTPQIAHQSWWGLQ